MSEPQGIYNVSWGLSAVEADSPEEAVQIAVQILRERIQDAPLFVVMDDETGQEFEIDYDRSNDA